jgi:hypothetical protein
MASVAQSDTSRLEIWPLLVSRIGASVVDPCEFLRGSKN